MTTNSAVAPQVQANCLHEVEAGVGQVDLLAREVMGSQELAVEVGVAARGVGVAVEDEGVPPVDGAWTGDRATNGQLGGRDAALRPIAAIAKEKAGSAAVTGVAGAPGAGRFTRLHCLEVETVIGGSEAH